MDSSRELELLKQSERQVLLDELKRNLEEYDIWMSTGSSSGSLPGFALEKGLVPAGWMASGKSKAIPFAGELSKGIGERGVNRDAVSFSSPDSRQFSALEYATYKGFNKEGWSPEKGMVAKRRLIENLNDPRYNDSAIAYVKEEFKAALQIEEGRLNVWDNLSPEEQQFVSDPFPIIYGINYKHKKELEVRIQKLSYGPGHDIPGEVFLEGKVDVTKLSIYCPRNKIPTVKDYLMSKGLEGIHVLPLEVFSYLVNLWSWQLPPDSKWLDLTDDEKERWKRRGWEFGKSFPNIHSYVDALRRWEIKSPVPV